jgi:predicted RNase H-like HicB family nuclease
MSTVELNRTAPNTSLLDKPSWHFPDEPVYECRAVFCPEEEGGFSAFCINLPGVISQGDTIDEAIENIADAFRETILYYRGANEQIPWEDAEVERPKGTLERWILVECGR